MGRSRTTVTRSWDAWMNYFVLMIISQIKPTISFGHRVGRVLGPLPWLRILRDVGGRCISNIVDPGLYHL